MISERQIEANRRNAIMSTGPRSDAGKAAVALNGIKHGLLSRQVLIKGESEADLVGFGKRLRAQLVPVGELELLLADRIVSTVAPAPRAHRRGLSVRQRRHPGPGFFRIWGSENGHPLPLRKHVGAGPLQSPARAATATGRAPGRSRTEAVDVEVSMSEPDELALHGRTSAVFPTDINGDADHAPSQ